MNENSYANGIVSEMLRRAFQFEVQKKNKKPLTFCLYHLLKT